MKKQIIDKISNLLSSFDYLTLVSVYNALNKIKTEVNKYGTKGKNNRVNSSGN